MSQDASLNSDGRQRKIDWRKKGLGWIPDYPDIRDFCASDKAIQEGGTLRKDEVTESLEDITVALIQALEAIGEKSKPLQDSINTIKNTLQDKILGSIHFETIRVYKTLRSGVDAPIEMVKLKTCLSILMQHGCIDNIFDNDLSNFLKWFNSKDFDHNTETLVKKFQEQVELETDRQKKVSLEADGIVGIETYSALIELFKDASRLAEFCKHKKLQKCQAKLLSTPSLIPQEIFGIILEELETIKFLSCNSSLTLSSDKHASLKSEFQKFLDEELKGILDKKTINKYFQDAHFPLSESVGNEEKNESITKFGEIFQNEFSIVDPIVSCIVQCIAPIAQFDDLTAATRIGLKNFCKYLAKGDRFKKYLESDSDIFDGYLKNQSLASKALRSTYRELATRASSKLKDLFESYKKEVVEEIEEITRKVKETKNKREVVKEVFSTLYLYFLLKEFLPESSHSDNLPNPFSKKEIVEVVEESLDDCPFDITTRTPPDPGSSESKGTSDALQLFPLVELQIPVSRSFRQTRKWRMYEKNRKYLFLPGAVDLSFWCSEIEDQKSLNACTAFAGVSLIEYFINRSQNKYTDVSPLFLYKVTRNLMNQVGDVGASVRDTMKAIALFGVPPEKHWPYQEDRMDNEPPPFCYAFAQNYQALKYFRLDSADISKEALLFQIKAVLAAGFPCMFGFTVYTSAYEETNIKQGYFPFPQKQRDKVAGGHAVVAVWYSDYKIIDSSDDLGALLIRNSWGSEWGENGYGWLPYSYVLKGLTGDWWSMLKSEWFDQDHFGLGAPAWVADVGSGEEEDQVVVDENEDENRERERRANQGRSPRHRRR